MDRNFLTLLGVVFYVSFIFLVPMGVFNDWIPPQLHTGFYSITSIDPGDDTGYYAFLRSAFFDGDFDFINEGNYVHIEKFTSTGYVFNNWQIGQSLLFLPFFLVGHLVALIYNGLGYGVSTDGYSVPYYMATAIASQTYLFTGLLLLFNILKKRFRGTVALMATLAIWLGSPLIYYTFIRQRMAHTAEFFMVVVFLWAWLKARNSEDYFKHALLGGILGFLCMVRLLDIGFLVLYFIDQIFLLKSKQDISLSVKARTLLNRMASFGILFVLVLLPQLLTWNQLNGIPLPSRHVNFVNQGLADFSLLLFLEKAYSLFFSPQWGLLLSAPLMVFGLIGVFLGNGIAKEFRAGLGAYLSCLFLMVILYPESSDSYGHRHLTSTLPILAWGLAGVFSWCSRNRLLSTMTTLFVILCAGAQYFMLIQYKVTLVYNDPEFTVKALSAIPSLIMNQPDQLLRSTNFIKLIFLDHPQDWNYNDFLYLLAFPASQLVSMIIVFAGFGWVARLQKITFKFKPRLVAGVVALTVLSLIILIGLLTPSKTRQEINNRKIFAELMKKGNTLLSFGKTDEAILLYKKAPPLTPNFWLPLYRIGVAFNLKEDFRKANKIYRKILLHNPHLPLVLFNLGSNLLSLGKFEEAKLYLKESSQLYPSNKDVYFLLGRAYARENNLEKASEMFEIAITLEPNFAEAHINLALLWTIRDNSDIAISHLEKAIKLGNRNPLVSKLSKLYKIQR